LTYILKRSFDPFRSQTPARLCRSGGEFGNEEIVVFHLLMAS
jgi:hypothetical protein